MAGRAQRRGNSPDMVDRGIPAFGKKLMDITFQGEPDSLMRILLKDSKKNLSAFLILFLFFMIGGRAVAAEDDKEVHMVFASGGKGFKEGGTITTRPGEELKVRIKVFIKQFKVKGGRWKKNKNGEWRFYKNVRGYDIGLGVGKMSLKILKEEFIWELQGEEVVLATGRELVWKAPRAGDYYIKASSKTTGQITTEGTASKFGIHVDYELPGAGKRIFSGEAILHIRAE
jgi:hypothetical protein